MKVHRALSWFLFLCVQDGNDGAAVIDVYSETEGSDITVQCPGSFPQGRKYFCKKDCAQTLIETTEVKAQQGRYKIAWKRRRWSVIDGDIEVTITQVNKSDSGLYRCGSSAQSYRQIELIITDARLDGKTQRVKTLHAAPGEDIMVECDLSHLSLSEVKMYFCRDECKDKDVLAETYISKRVTDRYSIELIPGGSLYVGITQLTRSDSGRYACGMGRTFSGDRFRIFEIVVADDPTTLNPAPTSTSASTAATVPSPQTTTGSVWLYLGLTLAVMVLLLLLAVLIYRRKRSPKPKEPPEETQRAAATETSRVYEDIRESRPGPSAPVETCAVYTRPNGPELTGDSPTTAEDDSSKLIYTEVRFSCRAAASRSSAPCADADNVVYSEPRVKTSSDSSRADDETSVYSSVS